MVFVDSRVIADGIYGAALPMPMKEDMKTAACGMCRRKQVGSLPWGIPTVVVYRQTGAQATNSLVTQDTDKDFIQVQPPCERNTYILRLIVLLCVGSNYLRGVPCLSLYSPEGKVTDLETNPSWLQLP